MPDPESRLADYLSDLGVSDLPPLTCGFDPGYDPATVESHLEQSSRLMVALKLSMACWMICNEESTRRKLAAARAHGVPTVAGGGPFEVAAALNRVDSYMELCGELGFCRIEVSQGFTRSQLDPSDIVQRAAGLGLQVQYEIGDKAAGEFTSDVADQLIVEGVKWLEAGASEIVVEARESAAGIGLFNNDQGLDSELADRFAREFGLDLVTFEAPTKRSQFALLAHFGRDVRLSNVRLEELLRVEIYRRGLHSDAFHLAALRPRPSPTRLG